MAVEEEDIVGGGSFVEERGVWTFLIVSAASCRKTGETEGTALAQGSRVVVERAESRVGNTDVIAVEKGGRGRGLFWCWQKARILTVYSGKEARIEMLILLLGV